MVKEIQIREKNTFFSSTGGGALGFEAAGSSGGNPSFLLLSACERKNIFKAKLLVFPTSIRNLNDKAREILKDEVQKLETLSSSNFWRIFSLALFSSSFSSLRNSIMLPMEGKKLVRSEYNKIKQKLVQAQIQRRKETNRFLSFCSSILLASRSSLPIRILS